MQSKNPANLRDAGRVLMAQMSKPFQRSTLFDSWPLLCVDSSNEEHLPSRGHRRRQGSMISEDANNSDDATPSMGAPFENSKWSTHYMVVCGKALLVFSGENQTILLGRYEIKRTRPDRVFISNGDVLNCELDAMMLAQGAANELGAAKQLDLTQGQQEKRQASFRAPVPEVRSNALRLSVLVMDDAYTEMSLFIRAPNKHLMPLARRRHLPEIYQGIIKSRKRWCLCCEGDVTYDRSGTLAYYAPLRVEAGGESSREGSFDESSAAQL
jgi:hypothetical protein